MSGAEVEPAAATGRDVGGWGSTAAQGLLLARWIAGELVAERINRVAWVAWVAGAIGLAIAGLALPFEPDWPFLTLAALLVLGALTGRLVLALVVGLLRRLALPRRARHLRREAKAARSRLTEALGATGVPVTVGQAAGFVWALLRHRRPHAGVLGDLRTLVTEVTSIPEVDHLRTSLAEAARPRGAEPEVGAGDGEAGPTAR